MKKRKASAPKVFVAALLAATIAKAFVLDVVVVSGNSMQPALRDGQLVVVNKLAWGLRLPLTSRYLVRWAHPKAGEVAVFLREGTYTIKRCVATEGMTLALSEEGGYNVVAGNTRLPLSYEQYKRLISVAGAVPRGAVFVAGDNTAASFDSRDYGLVRADAFCGRIVYRRQSLQADSASW